MLPDTTWHMILQKSAEPIQQPSLRGLELAGLSLVEQLPRSKPTSLVTIIALHMDVFFRALWQVALANPLQ
jgi:hypothetical protein